MGKSKVGIDTASGKNPVRSIGMNSTSLTGVFPSQKSNRLHQFESSLERDFLRITEFDPNVADFVEQPVLIEYENDGVQHKYIPDFLVTYKHYLQGTQPKPLLVEIKYRDDLRAKWYSYKPKFLAAMKFCDVKGWRFKILTEVEIRTPYLENARFLHGYKKAQVNNEDYQFLLTKIQDLRVTTPKEILLCSSNDFNRRASLLYCLWCMVANTAIGVDLSKKLTMESSIWDISDL